MIEETGYVFSVQVCVRYVNECKMLVYVASIVMGYGANGTGIESRKRPELFIFPKTPEFLQGPTSFLFNGYRGSLSWRAKAAGA